MQLMTPEHPEWSKFYGHVAAVLELGISCLEGEHVPNVVEVVLSDQFHFSPAEIAASVEWLKAHGAPCDCQVLVKFGPALVDHIGRIEKRLGFLETERERVSTLESSRARPVALPLSNVTLDPEKLQAHESAFRRGVAHALNLAGDLVRAGATADDLDILTDLAMDWRNHARPDVHVPEDLVRLWRQGERGITGIDFAAPGPADV